MRLTLDHLNPARRTMLHIMERALAAVEPGAALRHAMRREGDRLLVAGEAYELSEYERVLVVGAGKAAAPMGAAIEEILGDRLAGGVIVIKRGQRASAPPLARLALREAAHPVPDRAGLEAGHEILGIVEEATTRDLVIVLLSGGGSALLERLAPGITLDDLAIATDLLLRSGATIDEINALRKHLSQLKGGQLARAAMPATLLALVLSDVVGSPLDVIASGPTVPDSSTWDDCQRILRRYGLTDRMPAAVVERIAAGASGALPETPDAADPVFARSRTHVIGENATAALAARDAARAHGYASEVLTTYLEGEARELARVAVALGREVAHHDRPLAAPACLIMGGESTVTIRGEGKGGRNQELALAAALALGARDRILIGALATDGNDGPTDAAGAVVDGGTLTRATTAGMDPGDHLARNDAYPLLAATGDLLRGGPTHTNVNDLLLVLVEPPGEGAR